MGKSELEHSRKRKEKQTEEQRILKCIYAKEYYEKNKDKRAERHKMIKEAAKDYIKKHNC